MLLFAQISIIQIFDNPSCLWCTELARDALNSEGFCVIGGYMSPVNDAYQKQVCSLIAFFRYSSRMRFLQPIAKDTNFTMGINSSNRLVCLDPYVGPYICRTPHRVVSSSLQKFWICNGRSMGGNLFIMYPFTSTKVFWCLMCLWLSFDYGSTAWIVFVVLNTCYRQDKIPTNAL